jgi:hypothetical protein
LKADVEECSAHDLLCSARREKQLQTLEKRRKLEERLAEIAAVKKAKVRHARTRAANACAPPAARLTADVMPTCVVAPSATPPPPSTPRPFAEEESEAQGCGRVSD